MVRIVSWNINSIRLRIEAIRQLTEEYAPDIICLQEIKVINELFPYEACRQLGYGHIFVNGQKSYNGVAIISKIPITLETIINWGNLPASRHISALLPEHNIELHNLYIPAGGDIPDPEVNPSFANKLLYLEDATLWLKKHRQASNRMIMLGDFNIAPYENDVWSHKQLLKEVSHTPIEVNLLNQLREGLDWQDIARIYTPPSEKLYSWWSYRNRDWRKSNRGRRLDHIWTTKPLLPEIKDFFILQDYRDINMPSDHVPVVLDIRK